MFLRIFVMSYNTTNTNLLSPMKVIGFRLDTGVLQYIHTKGYVALFPIDCLDYFQDHFRWNCCWNLRRNWCVIWHRIMIAYSFYVSITHSNESSSAICESKLYNLIHNNVPMIAQVAILTRLKGYATSLPNTTILPTQVLYNIYKKFFQIVESYKFYMPIFC